MKRGKRSKIRQALGVWENRKSNGKKKKITFGGKAVNLALGIFYSPS
jgi:hypothetical protein